MNKPFPIQIKLGQLDADPAEPGRLLGFATFMGRHFHVEAIAVRRVFVTDDGERYSAQKAINESLQSILEGYHEANGSCCEDGFSTVRYRGKDWVIGIVPFAE